LSNGHCHTGLLCIDALTKKAKTAGAPEAEMAEAIFVAMALRAGVSFARRDRDGGFG
jgi:alkylhydroperoxidase/carboxymuconolactone decarboxylase family protein YurZ